MRVSVCVCALSHSDLDGAEGLCQEAVDRALSIDGQSLEALQTAAGLCLRHAPPRMDEACDIMMTVFDRVMAIRRRVRQRSVFDELRASAPTASSSPSSSSAEEAERSDGNTIFL